MSVQIPWYSLIPPAAVGDEIPRDRVSAALDAAVAAGPLTVVCAPSGFGKSVAVSAWCRSRDDAGWVTASTAVDAALTVEAGVRAAMRAADPEAELPVETGTAGLAAAVSRLRRPAVLVIDDAHLAMGDELGGSLLAPDVVATGMLRVVLVGQPALLAAVGGRQDVEPVVLGADRLAYSRDELVERFGAAGDDVHRATAGWPVAVRFATVPGRAGAPRSMPGGLHSDVDDSMLTEYVDTVLLGSLPADVATVALDTIVLGEFAADLATEVLGRDVAGILDDCVDRGLFITRLASDGRGGYRWHDLIAVHGLRIARRRDPERVCAVERAAAAAWQRSDPVTAARFAIRAAAPEFAARILRENWIRSLVAANVRAFDALCAALPSPFDEDPDVLRIRVCFRRLVGDRDLAEQLLRRARAAEAVRGGPPSASAVVSEAFLAETPDEVSTALAAAQRWLSQTAEESVSPYERFLIGWVASRNEIDPAVSLAIMSRVVADAERAGLSDLVRPARVERAFRLMQIGRLSEASAILEEAHDRPDGAAVDWLSFQVGRSDFARGFVAYWRGDFEGVLRQLTGIVSAPDTASHVRYHAALYVAVAIVDGRYVERWPEVRAVLAMIPDGAQFWYPWDRFRRIMEAIMRAAEGDRDGAARLVAPLADEPFEPLAGALLAAVLCDARQPRLAETAIRNARAAGESDCAEAFLRMTEALLAWDAGDVHAALDAVETALDVAAPEGLWQPFLRRLPEIDRLLRSLLRRQTKHRTTVEDLLARRSRGAGPEPLTARQEKVLDLMRSELSVAEIAELLGISPTTVKTHMREIYRKLGVHNRRGALYASAQKGAPGR